MLKRELINSLNLLHPVSKAYQSIIEQEDYFRQRVLRKGTLILLPGKNADELHFVGKGMFILYRYDADGEELILDFFSEHTFIMLPVDFYEGKGNEAHYIRAIEHSELLSISKTDMDKIYGLFPEAKIHSDKIRGEIFQRNTEHLLLLFKQKEDRYAEFVRLYKKIAARLTEYLISTFLGICTKTLNRSKRDFRGVAGTFVWLYSGHLSHFFA